MIGCTKFLGPEFRPKLLSNFGPNPARKARLDIPTLLKLNEEGLLVLRLPKQTYGMANQCMTDFAFRKKVECTGKTNCESTPMFDVKYTSIILTDCELTRYFRVF